MKKSLLFFGALVLLILSAGWIRAEAETAEVVLTTVPIGSPYYRHLAFDFNIDLKELVKFEKKGFGRSEIAMLVVLSESDVKKLKAIGNRRIKDHIPLETLAKENGVDYKELVNVARQIKTDIEARGDKDLPPPVFPTPSGSASPKVTPQKSAVEDGPLDKSEDKEK